MIGFLRRGGVGLVAVAVLLHVRPAEAFLFEEHANIGRDAVGGLSLAERKELERIWDAGLDADCVGAKRLLRRGKGSEVDDVDYQRAPTHNRVAEADGALLDFGALPATAADHSCSPVDMWDTATRKTWFPTVYTDVGKTEQKLHDDNPTTSKKLDAWHQGNLDLLHDDPDYLSRAGGNNAHFVFARKDEFEVDTYLARVAQLGTPMNAIAAYSFYHVAALAAAAKLATQSRGSPGYGAWAIRVLSIESFALHFLEDSFAAGHFVGFTTVESAAERTGTHDYYCENGLAARTWGAAPSQLTASRAAMTDLLRDGTHAATELEINQCLDAWRGGVSYAAHGDAFQSTPADMSQTTVGDGCPIAAPDASDQAMAARAVELSLHQVIEVAAGWLPLPAELDPTADDLATENVCQTNKVTEREANVVAPAIPYLSVVLSMTPTPYRSDVPMPHFRSDYGLILRGSAASRLGVALGGGGDTARFQGALQVGLGIGGNLAGLTTRSTDGLFYAEASAIGYGAEEPSDCTVCTPAPSRVGGGFRLHFPFMIVPGDTILALLALPFSVSTAEGLALQAARGSLWWHFERVHAGRVLSWQILLGRQVAVYWSGANGFAMQDLELPWVELRTRHLFSERLGSDGAVQLGSSLEWDRLNGPSSTLRTFAGAAYLRFAFDTQYDTYP